MGTEMSLDDCITWHKIRLHFDLDEVERAAIAGTITYLERVKRLERRLTEDAELGLGLGLQVYIEGILNYLQTGEEW